MERTLVKFSAMMEILKMGMGKTNFLKQINLVALLFVKSKRALFVKGEMSTQRTLVMTLTSLNAKVHPYLALIVS